MTASKRIVSFLFLLLLFSFSIQGGELERNSVYLTWMQDPTTTMTVQWLSPASSEQASVDTIYYQALDEQEWHEAKGTHFFLPQGKLFIVHRVELTQLKPDHHYRFRLAFEEPIFRFYTMPSALDHSSIRFVVGGDMYHDAIEFMAKTCWQAVQTDPHFAVIGGDIAYAVGRINSTHKLDRWIEWIKTWSTSMATEERRLIPVVSAIGNHDIGGHYNQTPAQAKIFAALFPMPGDQVYNVLDFGNYFSLLILDSGHANPVGGVQANWIKSTLRERQHVPHKFAVYHVPAYPSIRSFRNRHSLDIRKQWVPLFEQFGLQIAFEHHDHAYKRTYPLLKNKVHPKGIVYLGDGAWGVEKPRKPRSSRKLFYLAKFASVRHFILVNLEQNGRSFVVIDENGHVVDQLDQ
jgi:acid phosphatase type 7